MERLVGVEMRFVDVDVYACLSVFVPTTSLDISKNCDIALEKKKQVDVLEVQSITFGGHFCCLITMYQHDRR